VTDGANVTRDDLGEHLGDKRRKSAVGSIHPEHDQEWVLHLRLGAPTSKRTFSVIGEPAGERKKESRKRLRKKRNEGEVEDVTRRKPLQKCSKNSGKKSLSLRARERKASGFKKESKETTPALEKGEGQQDGAEKWGKRREKPIGESWVFKKGSGDYTTGEKR